MFEWTLAAGPSSPLRDAVITAASRALHGRLLPLIGRLAEPYSLHQIHVGLGPAPPEDLGLRPSGTRKGSAGASINWSAGLGSLTIPEGVDVLQSAAPCYLSATPTHYSSSGSFGNSSSSTHKRRHTGEGLCCCWHTAGGTHEVTTALDGRKAGAGKAVAAWGGVPLKSRSRLCKAAMFERYRCLKTAMQAEAVPAAAEGGTRPENT
ncbi:MAG: hypothetical protein WDW38_010969 [Sanguina aurantia]